jgi:orotidine-5'-phosphate decarboxylase
MELCVALDLPGHEENLDLAKKLAGKDVWMKVGLRSYIRDGRPFVDELRQMGHKIFLDLKLYDIPNTMADAAEEIAKMGVEMFNVHASAGPRAMEAVMERLQAFQKRPLVLAVTALTSFDEAEFRRIYGASIDERALQFARDAHAAGLDGVVCSVFESKNIKAATKPNFLTLTPGIRPFGEDAGDQRRVADIAAAKEAGVDFIVVGRPIYRAPDPAAAVDRILDKLSR